MYDIGPSDLYISMGNQSDVYLESTGVSSFVVSGPNSHNHPDVAVHIKTNGMLSFKNESSLQNIKFWTNVPEAPFHIVIYY